MRIFFRMFECLHLDWISSGGRFPSLSAPMQSEKIFTLPVSSGCILSKLCRIRCIFIRPSSSAGYALYCPILSNMKAAAARLGWILCMYDLWVTTIASPSWIATVNHSLLPTCLKFLHNHSPPQSLRPLRKDAGYMAGAGRVAITLYTCLLRIKWCCSTPLWVLNQDFLVT